MERMTEREEQVLRLVGDGRTSKQIAACLEIKERTVEDYVSTLLGKTGSENRTQLATFYREVYSLRFLPLPLWEGDPVSFARLLKGRVPHVQGDLDEFLNCLAQGDCEVTESVLQSYQAGLSIPTLAVVNRLVYCLQLGSEESQVFRLRWCLDCVLPVLASFLRRGVET